MRKYKDFKEIKKAYAREQKRLLKDYIKRVKDSKISVDLLAEKYWIKDNLTRGQYQKAITRNLDVNTLKELAISKEISKTNKKISDFEIECNEIASSDDIKQITIRVDWVKNNTWGMNPHCEVLTSNGYYLGSASGCGYDKLSSAIAEALNQDLSIKKLLYNGFEKALRQGKTPHEVVGYGCGYKTPYFEGGIGYSSIKRIFDNLGATKNEWYDTKTSDLMFIEF